MRRLLEMAKSESGRIQYKIKVKTTEEKAGVCKTVKNNLTILRHLSDGVGNNN